MKRKNAGKRIRDSWLLVGVLLLVSLLSGCRGAQMEEAATLISRYADDAAQYADDAYRARQLARYANTAAEVNRYLDDANNAARRAVNAAEEAQKLMDDVPGESQLVQEVERAQEAAARARANQTVIDRLSRVISYGSRVDDMSDDIIRSSIRIQEGAEQARVRESMKDILTASFCSTLVEALNNGELPPQEDIVNDLLQNAAKATIELSGVDAIAIDVANKVYRVANGQPEDELAGYKEYCEIVISQ